MIHALRRAAVACALLLSSQGCYTGTMTYVRPHAQIRSDSARVVAVVQETLTAQGLRVVSAQPEEGVVEAVTAPVVMGDLRTRERWRFAVREGELSVEMHPETRPDDARRWERDLDVCDCYHYAREREMLRAIRARLRRVREG